MKISRIFGFVLCLHVGIGLLLLVQPGCRTTQPPTPSEAGQPGDTYGGVPDDAGQRSGGGTTGDLIPAKRVDGPIDSAFNTGMDDGGDGRYAPRRPENAFGEFDSFEASPSEDDGRSVQVDGPGYKTYTVRKGDSLWAIAKRHDVSVESLYEANGLNENSVIRIGQEIEIPVDGATEAVDAPEASAYQPSNYEGGTETHTVRRGDTLTGIANRYDTTVRAIKAANNKSSDTIRVGETLDIPVSGGEGGAPDTPGASDGASGSGSGSSRSGSTSTSPTSSTSASSGQYRTHTVQAGEYPATIARRYGMTTSELLAVNGIDDPRSLRVGRELKVSASGSAASVDSRTETRRGSAGGSSGSGSGGASTGGSRGGAPEIRVVEAEPLVDEESEEMNTDAMFEDATEIPVIRMEDEDGGDSSR